MSCPFECLFAAKQYDFYRSKKCTECPHRIAEEKFKADFEDLIGAIFGQTAFLYKFDKYSKVLFSVISYEEMPKTELSVKNARMLDVYLREKSRFDKIDQLEKEKANQNV